MKKHNKVNRRNFLKQSLSAAVFTILPRHVLGGKGFLAPSDQLTKAVIGVGGMGRGHMKYEGARLLAVCDVDIVHIVTPPHWHALISVAAAAAGKDIWCEKPMTRTIGEGIKVIKAVNNYGRIFRLNTWFRFRAQFYSFGSTVKPIKKLVNSNMLGWPLKVTISGITGFNWKFYWSGKTNLKPLPVPKNLDYDMWLGPAPYKPYNPERVHSKFRGYWDYDGGGLGDMGQHYLDPVQYILGKDYTSPVLIDVDAPQQHTDAVGSWHRIEMTYDDGCKIILDGENKDKNAPFIEGPNGKLYKGFVSDIPGIKEKLATFPDPEPQVTDFIQAVRNRQKFALNEINGHRSCTLVNLGKIAVRLGRSLKFDPVKQKFIDDEGANRFINQPKRAPWTLLP
jgi:myo-inositol 2-dehydrogenase/D-chiro-inositol 1-dehydrogenase